jgi:hypothetical protein
MHSLEISNIDPRNPALWIGALVLLLLVVAAFAVAADQRKKKTEALRSRFGSEYDLALRAQGRGRAETGLINRVRRVQGLRIRELSPAERTRFLSEWDTLQARFIDHPAGAVAEADELVGQVMQARGFPASPFDRRVEDLSVYHAHLVDAYRSANAIALRAAGGQATTEDLRAAMIHYRSVVDDLLQVRPHDQPDGLPSSPPLGRSA